MKLLINFSSFFLHVEKFETACLVDEDVELHPFAFRTHTHKLGKLKISTFGYTYADTGHKFSYQWYEIRVIGAYALSYQRQRA